jgi:3-dehydroquinate synthase
VRQFKISSGTSSYEVLIGPGSLGEASSAVRKIVGQGVGALISDSSVAPLFAERLQQNLSRQGIRTTLITVPAGESAKTLERAGLICDEMIQAGLDRHSFVIGLGGGVIGDLSGFAAAIYQRGIRHIQIPTTLLAMVDSSIGGKTGVNTAAGKNLLGAVHHPSLVIADPELLTSLPRREFKQGFAEIIKHAIIADAEMFEKLAQASSLRSFEGTEALAPLIQRNIEIKAGIIANDEEDRSGKRAILNFGHTIGHGIERAGNYRDFFHGEAIALGMVAAARISTKRAGLTNGEAETIEQLLGSFSLPTKLPAGINRQKIVDAVMADKKFERGQVRFVVTPKIGSAYLSSDVTLEDIEDAIAQL